MTKQHRVFLVDDHPLVRQGLAQIISREADLTVCGEAGEAQPALYSIAFLKPDVVVLDLSLKDTSGMEVLRSLREADAHLPVLVLSMYDELAYAERALKAGANGYIMKQEASEEVLRALRRILAGEIYVGDRVANKMLRRFTKGTSVPMHAVVDDLTNREMEVFRLIGEGRGTREISEELHLSVKTVETYQAHIKEKLGLKSSRELTHHAIQWTIGEFRAAATSLEASGKR